MITYSETLAFMEGLGGPEIMLVFIIVLVLFGGDKLPEFARGAGKMMREFKKAASGVEDEFKRALEEDIDKKKIAPPAATPAPAAHLEASATRPPESPPPPALPASPAPAPQPPKMMPRNDGDSPV